MSAFRTLDDYEWFIYSICDAYPAVTGSTLRVERRGATVAVVRGEIALGGEWRLRVREVLSADRLPLRIIEYGYVVYRGDAKVFWYDSQPHPNDVALASTMPHHKHVPPDVKHHRIPAPGLSFDAPNLPMLIAEIEGCLGEP